MWAFATGIWIPGVFQANLFPIDQMKLLLPLLLVYSGLLLFTAGLFLFRRNNGFLATSFCSFGAFNLTRGALLCCEASGILPTGGTATVLQGCMIESFAYIALSLLVGAFRMSWVLVGVFVFTWLGYLLSGVAFLANDTGAGGFAEAGHIGGYFLIVAGAIAYYGGTALIVNTAWQRVILPIGGQA